jgi:hypothetical protein
MEWAAEIWMHHTDILCCACLCDMFLYNGVIPERTAKKQLRMFSGFALSELTDAGQQRLMAYIEDDIDDLLRKVARLLDLQSEGRFVARRTAVRAR